MAQQGQSPNGLPMSPELQMQQMQQQMQAYMMMVHRQQSGQFMNQGGAGGGGGGMQMMMPHDALTCTSPSDNTSSTGNGNNNGHGQATSSGGGNGKGKAKKGASFKDVVDAAHTPAGAPEAMEGGGVAMVPMSPFMGMLPPGSGGGGGAPLWPMPPGPPHGFLPMQPSTSEQDGGAGLGLRTVQKKQNPAEMLRRLRKEMMPTLMGEQQAEHGSPSAPTAAPSSDNDDRDVTLNDVIGLAHDDMQQKAAERRSSALIAIANEGLGPGGDGGGGGGGHGGKAALMALETRLDVKLNGLAEVQAQNTQLLDSMVKRMGQLEAIAAFRRVDRRDPQRAAQVNGPPEYTPSRTPSRLPVRAISQSRVEGLAAEAEEAAILKHDDEERREEQF